MNPLFTKADLVCIPVAFKVSKLYSMKPTSGSGDFAYVGAGGDRIKKNGNQVTMAENVPRLDYTGSLTCGRILLDAQANEDLTLSALPTDLEDNFTIYFEVGRSQLDSNTSELIKFVSATSGELSVFHTTNGRMRVKVTDDSANFDNLYTANDAWNENEKLKVALRATDTELKFYGAGALIETSTGVGGVSLDEIEKITNTHFYEMRIYTTTLTDAECKELTA